jgi:hypothetical protein
MMTTVNNFLKNPSKVIDDVKCLGWVKITSFDGPDMVLLTQKQLDDLLAQSKVTSAYELNA